MPSIARAVVVSVMFGTAVVVAATVQPDQAQPWQSDWKAFLALFEKWAATGEPATAFDGEVAGRTVIWTGEFLKLSPSTGGRTLAEVRFGTIPVRQRGGLVSEVAGPSVEVTPQQLPRWQALKAGAQVRVQIRMTLANFLNTLFVTADKPPAVIFLAQRGELLD